MGQWRTPWLAGWLASSRTPANKLARAAPLPCRLRGAALVCTRWLAVCMRRNLLRSVCIRYTSETQMSACMWLARRAAAHVQQLRLEGGSQMMWMDVEDVDVHFSRQLGIVLAACTELSRLELYDPQVDLESSWASGSLAGLSEFCCHVSCIGNGTRMPGTLTRLQLQVHAEQLFQVGDRDVGQRVCVWAAASVWLLLLPGGAPTMLHAPVHPCRCPP